MSKLTDRLNKYGFFNSSNFAHDRGVLNNKYQLERPTPRCRKYVDHHIVPIISYSPGQRGRAYECACWQVSQGSIPTDPNAHWRDYGRKTFDVYHKDDKNPQREAAIAWASEHFGVTEWKREPFGSLMPVEFVDARLKQLTEWMDANPLPEE